MELRELIEGLSVAGAYPTRDPRVEVRQTHISVVFLVGPFAYKIKKPLRLGFLDYSTIERRRLCCEAEVRLNRRLAPDVYLGVVPICWDGSRLSMEGQGELVEWAVKMRRLPEEATLAVAVAQDVVGSGLIEELGRRIAAFHARAERSPRIAESSRFEAVAGLASANFRESAAGVGSMVSSSVFDRVQSLTTEALADLKPIIDERVARGIPCDTHGDLRLEHVYLFPEQAPPGDIVIVDTVEFNESYRHADPVADMAFLVMELIAADRRDLAGRLSNAYFSASADYLGERLLPFHVAYRALVRAKVEGMTTLEPEVGEATRSRALAKAKQHWLVALGALEPPSRRPCLVLVGGLPGTGKSTLARALASHSNFQIIRSDQVRKELAGQVAQAAGPAGFEEGIYTTAWTERTYQTCLARAESVLFEGGRVLVDATFGDEHRRRAFLELAMARGVPAVLLICEADPGQIASRLRSRRHDLSDADWLIHQQAARRWEPPGEWTVRRTHMIDARGEPEHAFRSAIAILGQLGVVG